MNSRLSSKRRHRANGDTLAKTSSRMTTAITFSIQNDAGLRVSTTNWENLVLVVVLVSERVPGCPYRIRHQNSLWEDAAQGLGNPRRIF